MIKYKKYDFKKPGIESQNLTYVYYLHNGRLRTLISAVQFEENSVTLNFKYPATQEKRLSRI